MMALTQVDQGLLGTYAQYTGFKNRIINGAMMIDQRNAGASVTPTTDPTYVVDRWNARLTQASKYSIQQVTDAPTGFVNSLKVTSLSAYSVGSTDFFGVAQYIEGYSTSDLNWGTANAQTVTLSFWVKSSLTGTFGATCFAYQLGYPSYPFGYTINAANTWEYKTVTIPGPTSGTFNSTNSGNIVVEFSTGTGSSLLGAANTWNYSTLYRSISGETSVVGTNGATWQVTGVQLEKGSTATSFDYRPYGTELALCQRYLPAFNSTATGQDAAWGYMPISTLGWLFVNFTVTARVPPTGVYVPDSTKFNITWQGGSGGTLTAGALTFASAGPNVGRLNAAVAGAPSASGAHLTANASGAQILFTGCEL